MRTMSQKTGPQVDVLGILSQLEGALSKAFAGLKSQPGDKHDDDNEALDFLNEQEIVVKEERVKVYIRVVFLKIGEVDIAKEEFYADAFIQVRWREPQLDGKVHFDNDKINWAEYWKPKVYVENALDNKKVTVWHVLSFNEKQEAFVCQRRRIKASFHEYMELNQFPYDTQDLSLTITSERSEAEVELLEDDIEISSVNVQSFVEATEWHLDKHVTSQPRITTNIYKNSRYKNPGISFSCKVSRRSRYFFYNIILVMIFICSLAFSTFAVDVKLVQNRLQLSFILLLSNITFKFVVLQTLPKVSYLTYLDKYILGSMTILCVICAWHAVVSQLVNNLSLAKLADMIALIALASFYVLFNLLFLVIIQIQIFKRWRAFQALDEQQKYKIRQISLRKDVNKVTPSSGGTQEATATSHLSSDRQV